MPTWECRPGQMADLQDAAGERSLPSGGSLTLTTIHQERRASCCKRVSSHRRASLGKKYSFGYLPAQEEAMARYFDSWADTTSTGSYTHWRRCSRLATSEAVSLAGLADLVVVEVAAGGERKPPE